MLYDPRLLPVPNGLPELVPFMPRHWYIDTYDFRPYPTKPDNDEHSFTLFQRYKYSFGFHFPTAELMCELATILKNECGAGRLLDAGSGSGLLSQKLLDMGIDAFAADHRDYSIPKETGYPMIKVFHRDVLGDALDYVTDRFNTVLLSWPPFEWPFGLKVLERMVPGQWLVYQGEGEGGCCGDTAFWSELSNGERWVRHSELDQRLNDLHVTFPCNNDHWRIYRKRG